MDETKLFMVKKLLSKGFKFEEIEEELGIKDIFEYLVRNASEFSNIKFKKESGAA